MLKYCFKGSGSCKQVALTFDDGPNPRATLRIADILESFGVYATFFLIGSRCEQFPEIVKSLVERGHLIGNHSYSHGSDFIKGDNVIQGITGMSPEYVRPPFYNMDLCVPDAEFLANKKIVTGDIDSKDYLLITSNEVTINATAVTGAGSIIDLHDGSENDSELPHRANKTIEALPSIVKALQVMGFKLKRLDEMELEFIPYKKGA